MNKRDTLLSLITQKAAPSIPAAFFMHFDSAYHQGQAAIDKHLEFFRATDMDFVKIQYEQVVPHTAPPKKPEDWANAPRVPHDFFEPTVRLVEGLVNATKAEALVLLTLYSPFMWARHWAGNETLTTHLQENPAAVQKGLEIMVENVLTLVRGCQAVGVDGFYASTQGGETFRFPGTDFFTQTIKTTDLAVWDVLQKSEFNILHVCDYEGGYDDLTPFLDYPGQVVNCSLHLDDRILTPQEAATLFNRPFMGGLERKGILATGTPAEARAAAEAVLAQAPAHFLLAADCTVPSETPWANLKAAIEVAHQFQR